MIGMDRQTGQVLSGLAHFRQRVSDVLTTPIGSRVMRREYGSNVFKLIDNPTNASFKVEMTMAIYEAFKLPINGLSDLLLQQVYFSTGEAGQVIVDVEGKYLPTGEIQKISGIQL